MSGIVWFSDGLLYVLIAAVLATVLIGGSALFTYGRDRRDLRDRNERRFGG